MTIARGFLHSRILLTVLFGFWCRATMALAEPGGVAAAGREATMRMMRDGDSKLPSEFTVVFEMRIPAVWFDPKQGIQISRCTFAVDGAVQGLTIQNEFSADPVYRAPEARVYQPMDYDQDLNLILWRSLEKKVLSTSEMNRVYDVQQMNRVSPDGQVIERTSQTQVYEYPVGSTDSIYEVTQMRLASGRGFSRYLDAFKTERRREDGLLELVASGQYGPGLVGEWQLTIDPTAHYLIRWGALLIESLERPAIRVVTHGFTPVQDNVPLAAGGVLYFARRDDDYRVEISVLDYSPLAPDRGHLSKLRDVVGARIRDGSEVVDYRGREPRRYVVGEE